MTQCSKFKLTNTSSTLMHRSKFILYKVYNDCVIEIRMQLVNKQMRYYTKEKWCWLENKITIW